MIRRTLFVCVVAVASMVVTSPFIGAQPAHAECGPLRTPQEMIDDAAVIFSGTLTKALIPAETPTGLEASAYTFAVDAIFKGELKPEAIVYAMPPTAPDALSAMREGQRYVMFNLIIDAGNPYRPLGAPDNSLFANYCTGVFLLEKDAPTPEWLGTGKLPETIITLPPVPSTVLPESTVDAPLEDWKKPAAKAGLALAGVGLVARLLAVKRRRVFS